MNIIFMLTIALQQLQSYAESDATFPITSGHYHFYPYSHAQHSDSHKPIQLPNPQEITIEPQIFQNTPQYSTEVPNIEAHSSLYNHQQSIPQYNQQYNPAVFNPQGYLIHNQFAPRNPVQGKYGYNPLNNHGPQTFGQNAFRPVIPGYQYLPVNQKYGGRVNHQLNGLASVPYRTPNSFVGAYPLAQRNPNASLNNYRKLVNHRTTTPKVKEQKITEVDNEDHEDIHPDRSHQKQKSYKKPYKSRKEYSSYEDDDNHKYSSYRDGEDEDDYSPPYSSYHEDDSGEQDGDATSNYRSKTRSTKKDKKSHGKRKPKIEVVEGRYSLKVPVAIDQSRVQSKLVL